MSESFLNLLPPTSQPSAEQLEYITSDLNQDATVLAYAASGKTNTMVIKLLWHLHQQHLRPDEFVLCSFTNVACDEIVSRAKQLLPSLSGAFDRKTNCITLHKLAIRFTQTFYAKTVKFDKRQSIEKAHKEICESSSNPSAVEAVNEALTKAYGNLKLIIIDEAQDTAKSHYKFVQLLQLRIPFIRVHLVGDINQRLYNNCSLLTLARHADRIFTLRDNYRNSRKIGELATAMMPNLCYFLRQWGYSNLYTQSMQIKREYEGEKPILIADSAFASSMNKMVQWLTASNSDRLSGSLAFIVPKKKLGDKVADMLKASNISYKLMYDKQGDLLEEKQPVEMLSYSIQTGRPVEIYTIHGCKGMAFDTVVLFGFYYKTWDIIDKYYDLLMEWQFERFWYTAVTRARNHLAFVVESSCPLFQHFRSYAHLFDIPTGLYSVTTGTSKYSSIQLYEAKKKVLTESVE